MKAECEMKSLVRWDDPSTGSGRRAQVRAELDAYYARLYGLTRDELRYTPLASARSMSEIKYEIVERIRR